MKQAVKILIRIIFIMSLIITFGCSDDNESSSITEPSLSISSPVISLPGGIYDSPQNIIIGCETPGALITYTLEGSEPTLHSPSYYHFPLQLYSSATLKVQAHLKVNLSKDVYISSEIVSATYTINTILNEMILVPGGIFTQGDTHDDEGYSDELPLHQVTLSPFSIGKYEITYSQFIQFLNSYNVPSNGTMFGESLIDLDDYDVPVGYNNQSFYFSHTDCFANVDCAVSEISWYGAVVFCNWLSEEEELTPCYDTSDWSCDFSANGYRLPTEAEWEYAARGASNEPDYIYAGSDDLESVGWYNSNSGNVIHNGGGKDANGLGIYDMSGNVFEWCNDWWMDYDSEDQIDPVGASMGTKRVFRGGSWLDSSYRCRLAKRWREFPVFSNKYIGFRIARRAE